MRRVIPWAGVCIPPVILAGLGLLLFGSAGDDAAYRTYWAADRLVHDGAIVNYNGAHIEQSTSLLHTVLLALLHLVSGIDIPLIGPLLGVIAGVGTVIAAAALAHRIQPGAGIGAALLVSTSICIGYWSFAGLETTLASLCVLLLILACGRYLDSDSSDRRRSLVWSAAAVIALALVRPEMPLVLMFTLAGAQGHSWKSRGQRSVRRGGREPAVRPCPPEAGSTHRCSPTDADSIPSSAIIRRLSVLLGIAVAASAAAVGFRELYFHSALPAPARAAHVAPVEGLKYLLHTMYTDESPLEWLEKPYLEHGHKAVIRLPLLIVLALGLGTVIRRQRAQIDGIGLLAIGFAGVYTAFIVLSGGERMEGGRLAAPVYPVWMALAAVGVTAAARSVRVQRLILAGLIAAQLISLAHFARNASTGMPLWSAVDHANDLGAGDYVWFARTNRATLRFIPLLDPLIQITDRIAAARPGPVVVLSAQMGLPAYTLARTFSGRITLLDRGGLIDPALVDCAVLPADEPDRDCPRPDVIFDLGANTDALEQQGYVVMLQQRGRVRSGSDLLPGDYVSANVFIAVRIDLLPALGGMRPTETRFRELQGMD